MSIGSCKQFQNVHSSLVEFVLVAKPCRVCAHGEIVLMVNVVMVLWGPGDPAADPFSTAPFCARCNEYRDLLNFGCIKVQSNSSLIG
jgi:hypothetical protein